MKKPAQGRFFAFLLAERTGLEPATPGVTGRYSNQLNYRSELLSLRYCNQYHLQNLGPADWVIRPLM